MHVLSCGKKRILDRVSLRRRKEEWGFWILFLRREKAGRKDKEGSFPPSLVSLEICCLAPGGPLLKSWNGMGMRYCRNSFYFNAEGHGMLA